MNYYCYIKSHADAPDYEDECVASSKKEAIKIFTSRINTSLSQVENGDGDWGEKEVESFVSAEDECPLCKTPLITRTEARDGGHSEIVDYCEGCGWTSILKK